MMSLPSFNSYRNSTYVENSNKLNPKKAPQKITVYVEAIEDIAFWSEVFKEYEVSHNLIFEIMLTSYAHSNKDTVLSKQNEAGKYLLLCVDSDYDYLLCDLYDAPKSTESEQTKNNINKTIQKAKMIKNNEFIFQTYAYAIENFKCFADSLRDLCVKATFNTEFILDFPNFLIEYSKNIYELLVWNLLFYKKGITDPNIYPTTFIIEEFKKIVKFDKELNKSDFTKSPKDMGIFKELSHRVQSKLQQLKTAQANFLSEANDLKIQLAILGLEENNAYLFMQGHCLFDNVVLQILSPVCLELQRKVINTIANDRNNKKKDKTDQNQECEDNTTENPSVPTYQKMPIKGTLPEKVQGLMKINYDFKSCFLFSKIKADVQKYIDKHWS